LLSKADHYIGFVHDMHTLTLARAHTRTHTGTQSAVQQSAV